MSPWIGVLLCSLAAVGCAAPPDSIAGGADGGADGGARPDAGAFVDPSDVIFDPDHLLEIEIEIDGTDWDVLRRQHRDIFGQFADHCPSEAPARPYDYFSASVTVDGERIDRVGLRKKGTMGSASPVRPSLKLSFDEYEPGQRFHGLRRMTLNNNLQDPSRIHACLALTVFRRAGVPAPRCNFARVSVNGEYMGIYSHVESIKAPFLEREFGDASGNLYEGASADFRPVWVDNYEAKAGHDGDRGDLAAVVEVLAAEQGDLASALDGVIDVDAFLTFWALEVLVGHWDGYSASRNNHYLYRDPITGLFQFIPWGPDSAFGDQNAFVVEPPPPSVWAGAKLTRELYLDPRTRARYEARMRELLGGVWDERELASEVDRMQSLVAGHVLDLDSFAAGLRQVREHIEAQRDVIEADMASQPVWTAELPESFCLEVAGVVTGDFATRWGVFPADNPFETGGGALAVELDGLAEWLFMFGSNAGWDGARGTEGVGLVVIGLRFDFTTMVSVMFIDPELYEPGAVITVDGFDVFGLLVHAGADSYRVIGYTRGTLELDEAPTREGDVVSGSFELEILRDLAMM